MPPEINRENIDLNRKLPSGRSTTLFCDATGKPTPKIQWYFNNTPINDQFPNINMGPENKYIQVSNFFEIDLLKRMKVKIIETHRF